ncbi:internal scaffolding protein [Sigmofec virus UA08Rod_6451]|uniref:Internal scaffolding protein n=1 Tax=Sigmofec virus UA08Rod_6451 TaxID=2929230 RepID=A0A976N0L1_9VIRU|nr:internal scaffolding protein [Sigmofec virus UA08Rod_6451]
MSTGKVKIFSRYDIPISSGLNTGSDSIVDKSALADCDINNIIKRYSSVEQLEAETANRVVPLYGDSSIPFTTKDICILKQNLQGIYSSLPDSVSKEFKNYNDFLKTVGNMDDSKVMEFFTNAKFIQEQDANGASYSDSALVADSQIKQTEIKES